ncbi:MAG: InlB B-repeat-containing protein, partial [Christensenellaceae bacterium]|nr:InlB B-repeat-containing protein [Christensenellaceae bacterium]
MIRYTRMFTSEDINLNKISLPALPIPIPHNIEVRDPEIIKYILQNIEVGSSSQYIIRVLDDATIAQYGIETTSSAELVGITSRFIASEELVIPSTIDGYNIVGIADYLFYNDNSKFSIIESIVLPDTLIKIGISAFGRLSNLETVVGGSSLKIISDFAFAYTGLTTFNLPSTLLQIGNGVFFGCGTMQFRLDNELTKQGQIIATDSGSLYTYYDANNRALYRYGGSESSFSMPSDVKDIQERAFENALDLTSITLKNTKRIFDSAFINSGLTEILDINSVKLDYFGLDVFENTPFLNNLQPDANGFITIFATIIKYKGVATEITPDLFPIDVNRVGSYAFSKSDIKTLMLPDHITHIGEKAFFLCENLEQVAIHDQIEIIEGSAFRCCYNLKSIKFYSLFPPVIGEYAFANIDINTEIYVPFSHISDYANYWSMESHFDKFKHITVSVTLISEDSVVDILEIPYYGELTGLPLPVKYGYTFSGWYITQDDNSIGLYQNNNIWNLDRDTNLYAHWYPSQYVIYLNMDGGSEIGAKSVYFDSIIGTMPSPEKEGYTFGGWFDGYTQITESTIYRLAGDTTLLAHWNANTYKLIYNANGGQIDKNSKSVTYASAIGELSNPSRLGYSFAGWNSAEDGSGSIYSSNTTYMVASDITIYATWNINTYTLKYVLNGGSSVGNTLTYTIITPTLTLSNTTKTGYAFAGWYNNAQFTGARITAIEQGTVGNFTFYAKWTANQYNITLNKIANDAVISATNAIVSYDSQFTLPVPTRVGYVFEGWYDSSTYGGIRYTTNDGHSTKKWDKLTSATVYAKCRIETYTIKLNNGRISKYFGLSGISDQSQELTFGEAFDLKTAIQAIKNTLSDISLLLETIQDLISFWYKPGHKIVGIELNNINWFECVPDLGNDGDTITIDII